MINTPATAMYQRFQFCSLLLFEVIVFVTGFITAIRLLLRRTF